MNGRPPSEAGQAVAALRLRASSHFAECRRPFVTLCYAQGIDGTIAQRDGAPMPVSGGEATQYAHALRAMHMAILVGVGTVITDDPLLTTRLVAGPSPHIIVLDSMLRTPVTSRCLLQAGTTPLIATTPMADEARAETLRRAGAEVVRLPADPSGRVALPTLLQLLGERGLGSLMVEGGSRVLASFLRERLAHHLVVTLSMRYLAGKNVLPDPGSMEPGLEPNGYPGLMPTRTFWLGTDLILHADPTWERP